MKMKDVDEKLEALGQGIPEENGGRRQLLTDVSTQHYYNGQYSRCSSNGAMWAIIVVPKCTLILFVGVAHSISYSPCDEVS